MKKLIFPVVFILALLLIPKNSLLTYGYGIPYQSSTDVPVCGNENPGQVVLYQPGHVLLPKATGTGEVRLNWLKNSKATKYTVGFGTQSGNYIYGLPDVGNTDNFTVRYLTPGRKYFFAVKGVNECKPGPWSMEWSVVAPGAGSAITAGVRQPFVTQPVTYPTKSFQQPTTTVTVAPRYQQVVPTSTVSVPATRPSIVIPTPAPEQPKSLWQRILGIFGL